MKTKYSRIQILFSAALFVACGCQTINVSDAVDKLASNGSLVRTYAAEAKRQLKPPKLNEAMRLYTLAKADNDGFIAVVQNGILFDGVDETQLKERSQQLEKTANAFVAYCSTNLTTKPAPPKDGGLLLGATLVQIGFAIYDGCSKRHDLTKAQQADWVKTNFVWTAWPDIK